MKLTRRHLLSLAPGALAAAALVGRARPLRAAPSAGERRFLFVYAKGGWDPAHCFAPAFDNANVDMEASAERATAGDLVFVDQSERPRVKAFLEAYADRTAFLNAFEVRSITHTRCEQMLFTGSGASGGEDWAAILAASSGQSLSLPSLVLSGPAYTSRLSSKVVRSGRFRQLEDLVGGNALTMSEHVPTLLGDDARSAVDAWLAERTAALASAQQGPTAGITEGYAQTQRDIAELQALGLDLSPPHDVPAECASVYDQLGLAVSALASGATRCATVQYDGVCGATFDDHDNLSQHGGHWDGLFGQLSWTMEQLQATAGPAGGSLADETVVVVLSEMGRHPRLNHLGGKDHWTFTSAMLVGAGVAGGRIVGEYDEYFMGKPVDPASGDVSDSGVSLTSAHLGATLLALGDVDPGDWVEAEPVLGLVEG